MSSGPGLSYEDGLERGREEAIKEMEENGTPSWQLRKWDEQAKARSKPPDAPEFVGNATVDGDKLTHQGPLPATPQGAPTIKEYTNPKTDPKRIQDNGAIVGVGALDQYRQAAMAIRMAADEAEQVADIVALLDENKPLNAEQSEGLQEAEQVLLQTSRKLKEIAGDVAIEALDRLTGKRG